MRSDLTESNPSVELAEEPVAEQVAEEAPTEEEAHVPTPEHYFFVFFQLDNRAQIGSSDVLVVLKELQQITSPPEHTTIDLVLNAPGGDIYSAYKIINIMRARCTKLRVVVPLYAKSAATLMALGGDCIVMGPESELGPLDLPMEHPLTEGIQISALDGVRPVFFFAGVGSDLAFRLGLRMRRETGISRKDALDIASRFAADYVSPVTSHLDPLVVNMCFRMLGVGEKYAREFLQTYMFQGEADASSRARVIARRLVWQYPSHEFAIGESEGRALGLNIEGKDEYGFWEPIWSLLLKVIEADEMEVLRLIKLEELTGEKQEEGNDTCSHS